MLSDVVFCGGNFLPDFPHGKTEAHQVVRAMLESSMKERQTQRIQLNDTPREAVSLLLEILLLGTGFFDWIMLFVFQEVVTFWKQSWKVWIICLHPLEWS